MINIFIGYDRNEIDCVFVLSQSILRNVLTRSIRITIHFIRLNIKYEFSRERSKMNQLNFLLVDLLLLNYGLFWLGLFMDCDMLMKGIDISELWSLRDDRYGSVQVCKHDYMY